MESLTSSSSSLENNVTIPPTKRRKSAISLYDGGKTHFNMASSNIIAESTALTLHTHLKSPSLLLLPLDASPKSTTDYFSKTFNYYCKQTTAKTASVSTTAPIDWIIHTDNKTMKPIGVIYLYRSRINNIFCFFLTIKIFEHQYQNKGFGTEACKAVFSHIFKCFRKCVKTRVGMLVPVSNKPMNRVAEKLGLEIHSLDEELLTLSPLFSLQQSYYQYYYNNSNDDDESASTLLQEQIDFSTLALYFIDHENWEQLWVDDQAE